MALRNISPEIKNALADNDSLLVYHLVKFEKPSQLAREAEKATDYVYLTDAPYVVNYDSNDYHPGGLLKVGKVPENTEAKATSLSLTLSATKLGKQANAVSVTNSSIASDGTGTLTVDLDLFKSGFYAGDTVKFTKRSDNSVTFRGRIDRLHGNGTKVDIKNLEDTTIAANSSVSFDIRFDSSEVDALVAGGVDNSGSETVFSSVSFDNYINRSVTIYRVFADPTDGSRIGNPVLLFKGIIAKGTLNDKVQGASTITWSLTSHWGDFVRVNGRITSDEFHRGLDSSGISNEDSAIRPEYIHDLGFMHADSSLNVLATYTDLASRYKQVKRGGLAGFMGMKKLKEEKYEVTRELDLSLNLEAKYIPLVYGVQKVDTIPVFADVVITQDTNSEDNISTGKTELFQAQVLCEGPIGGVYDIYMEDKSLVCRDKADSDVRLGSADDIPCFGRMDRGDVLSGGNLFTNTPMSEILYGSTEDLENTDIWRHDPNVIMQFPRLYGPNTGFQNSTTGPQGILHGQSFRATLANDVQITVHAGREDQEANQTLLGIANAKDFLVQQQYYQDDATTYWTANHKLLDTAYVVTRDSITAEDGKAPDLSFVVRGKFVDCHNYDGSYRISNGLHTNFDLGDTVSVTLADGTTPGGTARIVDKWSFLNASNLTEYRIRLGEFSSSDTEDSIITDGDIGKFSITKDSNTLTFLSPEYSNNPSAPVSPTDELTAGGFVFSGSNFTNKSIPLERKITDVTTYEPVYTDEDGEPETVGTVAVVRKNYKYILDFSSLPTFTQNVLKVAKETSALVDLTITANSHTQTMTMRMADLDDSTMEYIVTGLSGGMESLFGTPSNTAGTTTVTATGGNFVNRSLITQNTSDTLDPTDTEGVTVEITEEDVVPHDYSIRMPSTAALRTFCNTNSILCLHRGLHTRFNIANISYKYGVKGTHLDIEQWGDFRVSTNPAMQLLDYLTSDRYGKGLRIGEDLDLKSFREVARSCDTRSDIVLMFANTVSISDDEVYRYPTTGDLLWEGKVSNVETVTYDGTSYKQVTFTNCIGKLGRKWNNWYSYPLNDLVWTTKGYWAEVSTAGTISAAPTQAAAITVNLRKVWSGADTDIAIDTALHTNIGNPFVKKIENGNVVSGYSLYDSDDVKYWKYVGWDNPDQRFVTRHQTNITIDTSQSLFDNVNSMLRQFNGILRFANGTYFLDQRVKAKAISDFTSDEIITEDFIVGDIKITDKGISKTFNSVNAQIIDPANNFEARSIAFYNSNYKKQDKGIPRQGSYEAPGISNYFNARMNIKQVLDESRAGLDISFTMAPRGYMLLAGNLIAITYDRFNWTKKLFRIESLSTRDDLLVDVVAKEHNDNAYVIESPASDLVASYAQESAGKPPVKVRVPTSLTAGNNGGGGIDLSWTNASNYNDATHTVEIWRSNSTSFSGASLIGTTKGTKYTDQILETGAQTRYYWIRYSIRSTNSIGNPITVHSKYEPRSNANGADGNALSITTEELNTGVTVNDGGVTFPDSPTGTPTINAGITSIGSGNAGFFLGYDGSNHVFQVGDPSGNNLKFDGTDLALTGSEFSVTAPGATQPSITGTTTAGKGSLLKADGDVFFGDSSGFNIFFDQSEGTLTLTGEMVTEDNIATSAITADKISANSINADKIAANTITTDQLAANSITADQIAANSINSDMITANSVVSSLITASTIQSSHIKSNSIVATIIDATSISASDIQTATLSALSANLGDITAGTMKGGSIPDANSAPAGSETGAFMDLTGGKMVFGNANKHILFDGSDLVLSGVTIDAQSIINANASLSIKEDGTEEASSATALNFTNGLNVSVSGDEATINLDTPTDNNFTNALKTKLDGIAVGANAYVLPNATTTTVGGVSVGARLTVDGSGDLSADIQSDNNFTTTLKTKLDNIEAGATADQTAAEIRSLVESATDSNVFTDADHTKLNNIESGATGDQTASEIRALVASASDSNVFTDTEKTKLSNIEANATADQTAAEIRTLVESATDSNVFTDADHTKLNNIATNANNYSLPTNNVTNASVAGSTLTLTREGAGDVTFTDTNTQYSAGSGLGLSGTAFSVDSTVVRTTGTQSIGGAKTFTGNVTFSGTTTYINTQTLNVGDNIITLNADYSGNSPTENAGIEIGRGGGTEPNKTLLWDEGNNKWTVGSETFVAGTFEGSIAASNITGDIVADGFGSLTTDDLAQGTNNLYFANGLARAALSAGTGISYNSSTGQITNSAPDQTVSLTGSGATTVTGTYPNFTISSTDNNTVPANATITITAGTDLSTGGNFTTNQSSNETITINHSNISRSNTTTSASPGYGTSFTAIDSITTNARGHVTAVNTKTVTIPASDNTDTNTVTQIREDSGTYRTGNITLQSGTNVTISEPSAGVFNFAATDTNTTNFNIQANGGTAENISAGETINFIGSGSTTVSRSGNSVTISSSAGANNFVDGASFNTGNGIITLSRSGLSNVTVDIDGRFINNTATQGSNLYIRNTSPTIYLRDTDHISSMVHQNSNVFYVLRADAADDVSWTTFTTSDAANGRWPLEMNLTNSGHYVRFGSHNLQAGGYTVWHSGNDGANTGLHADLLDGQHGSYYLNYNNFTNKPSIPSAANNATITLSAGNGLTTGGAFTTDQGTNETITFHVGAGTGISVAANTVGLATAGPGAGTYGSTANSTKIDTITLDAYGRVTAVATGPIDAGSTGTVTEVTVGTGLDVANGTTTPSITLDLAELSNTSTMLTTDNFVVAKNNGNTRKIAASEVITDLGLITASGTQTISGTKTFSATKNYFQNSLQVGSNATTYGGNTFTVTDGTQGFEVNPNSGNIVKVNAYSRTNTAFRELMLKASSLTYAPNGVEANKVDLVTVAAGTTQTGTLIADIVQANLIQADMIQANAITADKISAGSITAEQLQISNNSSGSAGIYMDYNGGNSRIDIRDSSALRVRIGYLA